MKSKLKIIIPIGIAIIAIALAFVFIRFTPLQKNNINNYLDTAYKSFLEQDYEAAIAQFKKVLHFDPRNIDAYIGIAQAYEAIGDTESALEWLHKGYDLTGDSSLEAEIDRINGLAEEVVTAAEGTATEPSSNAEKFLEKKIVYADNWYSIFKYDENENIISMDLYTSSDQKRLSANYDYSGSLIKRTVYVDDVLYEEVNVTFSDIMAEVEAEKKERANTTQTFGENNGDSDWSNYWKYDDKGELVEQGGTSSNTTMINYFNDGRLIKSNEIWTYPDSPCDYTTIYDEKGYAISCTGIRYGDEINDLYTYDYDKNGYPIIEYINGKKHGEYANYYKEDNFIYEVYRFKNEWNNQHELRNNVDWSNSYERNNDGQYIRAIIHSYNDYNGTNATYNNTHISYYILSYDNSKVIDEIIVPETELPLFGCPFCYEEN